jgi:hypothetical protein
MRVLRLPVFGWLEYTEARYYGWRHCLHVGYWLLCWGDMTGAEIDAYESARRAPQQEATK